MKSLEIMMIPVKDRQKAKEFYLNLGFQVVVEATDPHGDAWIQMGLPNGNTTISLASFQASFVKPKTLKKKLSSLK